MKIIISILAVAALSAGGYFLYQNYTPIRCGLESKFSSSPFYTFKARYSLQEIIDKNQTTLLKNSGSTILEPKIVFLPLALMNVKYTMNSSSSGEGALLWGLTDGEMVVSTASWETTHGFEDCINAKANKNDLRILAALMESGGVIEKETLYQKFKFDPELLDKWIESCREKKLVATANGRVRLHFQNPKLENVPVTAMEESLVTLCSKGLTKVKKRYSVSQIERFTEEAFGSDFAIREAKEVFLPVFAIPVQHGDGTVLTTYWNAITGKKFVGKEFAFDNL